MATKLTLSIDKTVVEDAKQYLQGQSLSKLVENYFKVLLKTKDTKPRNSIVQQLVGLAKLPQGKTSKDVIVDYLLENK